MLGPGTPSLTTFTSLVISHFMALHVNSQISISSPHISPNSRPRHPAATLTSICRCERHLRFQMSKIRLLISPQNLLSPVFLILINIALLYQLYRPKALSTCPGSTYILTPTNLISFFKIHPEFNSFSLSPPPVP